VQIGVGLVGSAVGFLHAFDIHAGRHIMGEGRPQALFSSVGHYIGQAKNVIQ